MSAPPSPKHLALIGVLSVLLHIGLRLWTPRSGLEVLPVFVPASLSLEREQRATRGQPAGRGGMEAAAMAEELLQRPISADRAAELRPLMAEVRAQREALLDARGRRHHLNVALMRAGARLGRTLSADQWDWIQGSRDQVKAGREAALFDRLEAALGAGAAGGPRP